MKKIALGIVSAFLVVSLNWLSACTTGTTETPTSTSNAVASSSSASAPAESGASHGGSHSKKININNAILSELDKIEGKLGVPALSNKIQSSRPYTKTEELVSKKVIDQAQYDQIKDLVTIEDIKLTGEAKDVDYLVKLGLMKGHMMVAKELITLGKIDQAEPHIGHPVEEIYADVEEQLNERKVKEFKSPLIALHDQIKAGGKDKAKLVKDFETSMKAIDDAITGLPEAQRRSPKFLLQVINGLLDSANSEYTAAIADGKVKEIVEYQDSRGFIIYAGELYKTISAQLTKDNAAAAGTIGKSMTDLAKAWPAPIPPAAPVLTPEDVTKLVKSIEGEASKISQAASPG
jgi:DNA uptake protein ComE-like DNA-binding protein